MRRQGRQHGVVRTYPMLSEASSTRRKQRSLNELSSPPTAGFFTKVSSKPNNHSKFTGKCHIHPITKAKDKAKGARKMRSSSDVVSSYRLITWRVVDSAPAGFKVSGFSATGVLDYLDRVDDYDYDYDYESESSDYEANHDHGIYDYEMRSHGVEIEEIDESDHGNGGVEEEDDDGDDRMSFCEVGFVWEALDGDESWCLVEEI